MIMKGYSISILLGSLFVAHFTVNAQESNILTNEVIQPTSTQVTTDTIPPVEIDDADLDKVIDLRSQFEKQNKTYTTPTAPSASLLRFLKKDELNVSDEAMYWARLVRDASTTFNENMTFKDTIIVNPLFLPVIYRGEYLPKDLNFIDKDIFKTKKLIKPLIQTDTIFKEELAERKFEEQAHQYVENNYPTYFRYSLRDLPKDVVKTKEIVKKTYEKDLALKIETEADLNDVSGPNKFIPSRRYWTSGFESTIQFAQNYISKNWSNGGNSNLNMTTRQYFKYDYNKDKIRLTNEMEIKLNMNTLPSSIDTVHAYKVNDDVLRLHSNFGYKAFNKWYYTLDFTFKTQMIKNFAQNSEKILAAFLSPMSINIGLGMKYDLEKSFKERHKKLKLSVNVAPVSYDFMYSTNKSNNMDLARHGFKQKEGEVPEGENPYNNVLNQIGSKVEANMVFSFNRNVSWTSRFVYFTSYHRINSEFENTLNLQISRFFSTRINLQVRYDDGVARTDDFKSYFQVNELLSFGFNYKW
ncbi:MULTISPECIES: DUF3078 domain-containing protein [Bacteroidales]|uniref:DUF3078 domain-containing protein n=1 Tax=Parabacteroides bouchesdurhonensis TaxID=1936995 RepID=UPI000E4A5173|nr:DUF3078 domain-containing protein [Bacteroides sp. AM07-16]